MNQNTDENKRNILYMALKTIKDREEGFEPFFITLRNNVSGNSKFSGICKKLFSNTNFWFSESKLESDLLNKIKSYLS